MKLYVPSCIILKFYVYEFISFIGLCTLRAGLGLCIHLYILNASNLIWDIVGVKNSCSWHYIANCSQ